MQKKLQFVNPHKMSHYLLYVGRKLQCFTHCYVQNTAICAAMQKQKHVSQHSFTDVLEKPPIKKVNLYFSGLGNVCIWNCVMPPQLDSYNWFLLQQRACLQCHKLVLW